MTGIPILDILFKQSTRKQMLVVLQYADVAELADALDLGSSDQFEHSKKYVFMRFREFFSLNRFFIFR